MFTLTGAGAAVLASVFGALRFLAFSGGKGGSREAPAEALAVLSPGHPVHVASAGAWFVKKEDTGEVLALDDRCPHLGCRYDYAPEAGRFRCPCHGSEFDLTGNVLLGPADRSAHKLAIEPPVGGVVKLTKARVNDKDAPSLSAGSSQ